MVRVGEATDNTRASAASVKTLADDLAAECADRAGIGPLDDTSPVMVWSGAVALAINMSTEISGPGRLARCLRHDEVERSPQWQASDSA